MAARRIAGPTINWAAIAERVPSAEKPFFLAFKTKSDQYLRRMMANPETMPKLDWGYYKKNIPLPGLVDKFQKELDALKIPYPEDKYLPLIDTQEKEIVEAVKELKATSDERIQQLKAEVERVKSLLPFEEMTMEDFKEAYPDLAINPDKPTYWPHNEEEQLTEEEKKAIAG